MLVIGGGITGVGHRPGRRGARPVGGPGGEGRLRGGHLGTLLPAGARRPAVPGTWRVRPGPGVAAGAGHLVPAGAAPGPAGTDVHAGRRPASPGHVPGRADRVRAAGGGPEHRLPPVGERRAGPGGHPRLGRTVARLPVLRVPGGRRPADHRGGPGRACLRRAAGQPRPGDRAPRRGPGDGRGRGGRDDRAAVRGPGPGRGQRDRGLGRRGHATGRRRGPGRGGAGRGWAGGGRRRPTAAEQGRPPGVRPGRGPDHGGAGRSVGGGRRAVHLHRPVGGPGVRRDDRHSLHRRPGPPGGRRRRP